MSGVVSTVVSERLLLLAHAPISMAPRVPEISRIEIRLLRDTRRVLEYLSKKEDAVSHTCYVHKMSR